MLEMREGVHDRVHQGPDGVGPSVGESGLGVPPAPFVGIEFRGIAREGHHLEAREQRQDGRDREPAVNIDVVPGDDDRPGDLPQERDQELGDLVGVEVVQLDLEVEAAASAPGTQRHARDHRYAIVVLPVAEERRLPARRPGAPHVGNQLEARLVDEDEVRVPAREVFLPGPTPAASTLAIAASARFKAHRSGFCGVQPHWWRSRPTWAG